MVRRTEDIGLFDGKENNLLSKRRRELSGLPDTPPFF